MVNGHLIILLGHTLTVFKKIGDIYVFYETDIQYAIQICMYKTL